MSGTVNVVTFDYAGWIAAYPEFATTVPTTDQAQGYFDLACLYCDNTPSSAVPLTKGPTGYTTNIRQPILYALTAHVAQLTAGSVQGTGPAPASPLVGRVSAVSEGSVNVTVDLQTPGSAAWFSQTKYGLFAWQALSIYRMAIYAPPRQVPRAALSWPGNLARWP